MQAPTAPPSGASHEPERWRLRGVPSARGLDEWTEILAATHLGFDIRPTPRTPGKFNGAVSRRRFGGLALVDCASSPWLGRHGKAAGGDAPGPIMGFPLRRKSGELLRERGREGTPTARDHAVWDRWAPTPAGVGGP